MVVALTQAETSQQAHKKNRRKITRKNGAKPGTNKPTDPSSSSLSHNASTDDDNEEMHDITETADLPEGFTKDLFPVPQSTSANADDDDELMIDADPSATTDAPLFPPASASAQKTLLRSESRRVPIPPHRMTPLKKDWVNIFGPLTEILGLQVRMNVQRRCIEIRTSKLTKDIGAIQKGADFCKAYSLGFDVNDAIALLRLDDLYLDSFEIKDVKTLHGDHLSRAIGRIAGQDGKTKFTIENASRTRIVLADTKIHIMGSFQNIKVARDAIVSLILGSPPGKVYSGLRTVSARMKQRAM